MRPELRWLVMTALIVGVLLTISALALDRPDVVWTTAGPACPACRAEVAFYAYKCRFCDTPFDWSLAPEDVSPLSSHSLSRLEADALRADVKRVGAEAAARLVADTLALDQEAAAAYLDALGRGRCGQCGGTGRALGATDDDAECPVCFGARNCIASGGTGYSTWGDAGAARAFDRLLRDIGAVPRSLDPAVRRKELERMARAFLADHLGTVEAARLPYWKDLARGAVLTSGEAAADAPPTARRAADVARERLDKLLTALRNAGRP